MAAAAGGGQAARAVVMIRPAAFGFNAETAQTNVFQVRPERPAGEVQVRALREFDGLVRTLERAGGDVIVFEDRPAPACPDAVFPDNWISFHPDGTVALYPMQAPVRRQERRPDVLDAIRRRFAVSRVLDLTAHENEGRFLEGAGSLVFDHGERRAYAALSPRTDAGLAREAAEALGCEPVIFDSSDGRGRPIYHTNVLLSVGEHFAVVCLEAIPGREDRERVRGRLEADGKAIVPITLEQMGQFAANILEIQTTDGGRVVAMSTRAYETFRPAERRALEACAGIVVAPIPTIETVGGGGVRCMMADVHLAPAGATAIQ